MQVGAQELGDCYLVNIAERYTRIALPPTDIHILKRRNENIAQADDLLFVQRLFPGHAVEIPKHTFSWRRCLSSFSSRYVRLDRTGVLNGFMIFLTATGDPVSWSFAELFLV